MKPKRPYRKITPEAVTRFMTERAIQGNGTAAVSILEPDINVAKDRAYKLSKAGEKLEPAAFVERGISEGSKAAISRVQEIVLSNDEKTALSASKFLIDHARGKAVQRSESKSVVLNIQSVLE